MGQVGAALGEFRNKEADINTKIQKLIEANAALKSELNSLRTKLEHEEQARISLGSLALAQCKLEVNTEWRPACDGGQTGNKVPTQSRGFTPITGIERGSTWSGWQYASNWNGGPYNCLSFRIVCRSTKDAQ